MNTNLSIDIAAGNYFLY